MPEKFLFNPALPFICDGYPGNRLVNDRFVNADGSGPVGYSAILRWMTSRNPQRAEKKAEAFRLKVHPDERIFTEPGNAFSWLGHSAFLFRLNGKLLLTDPALYSLPGTPRTVHSPFSLEMIAQADYVLFTHTHRDHFDEKSVKQLLSFNPALQFLVPLRMTPLLKKLGAKQVTEAGWFQRYQEPIANGIRIDFLPARHWNRRYLHDTNRELWGSFMIATDEHAVYFAGDTAPAGHFREISELYANVDYGFMPVGAYKPDYIMKYAHMSPEEAVEAYRVLGAKTFVPMHYGTFDLADEPMGEPPLLLRGMKENGTLPGRLLAPAVGEYVRL